ncbi:MAG: YqaJ viral recombinase family protein [Micrococcus sp.]|nr:YqaJ viral recombinase family protein [Micrococcus sp.]
MTTYRHTTFKATPTTPLTPGTPEWSRTVSASKVGALLGLSTYDSAYSLWAKATGRLDTDQRDTKATQRGNLMEATLLEYLRLELGDDYRVTGGASYVHPDNPTWTAAPDGHVYEGRRRTPFALVECKTARHAEDWGREGTAEIPAGYLCQIAWQMYVTGARTVYVPAQVAMEFRLYIVQWEDIAEDVPLILQLVHDFQVCVADDRAPAWDGSDATYQAVRRMHPDITDGEQVIAYDLAIELWESAEDLKNAEARKKRAHAEALAGGTQKYLVTETGEKVATRTARGNGTPYLTIAKPKVAALAAA